MNDPKGKADTLKTTINVNLGGWRQWPGEVFQWLRCWCLPGHLPNAAWVREDGKGTYEWCAWLPHGESSSWQPAKTGEEGRDLADDWLIMCSKRE